MSELKTNRNEKDTLFKVVFGENPDNALSLYNAINSTKYTNVEDLEITTLRNGVYIGIRNDVSFLFNDDMNLYEHQSTYCPNMPLRGLGYFTDIYKEFLGGEESAKIRLHDSRLVKIPAPRYFVFYNGTKGVADRIDLKLSDAYEGEGDLDVTAHMINVNKDYNKDLMEQCRPLEEYAEFIYRLRAHIADGLSKAEAVKNTIDECISEDIMADLLRKERARMENILIQGLTEEEQRELYEMQCKRGREEGRNEGREEGASQAMIIAQYLVEQGRFDDLKRASEDSDYRTAMMEEMNQK